jgi:hypothetical protein
MKLFRRIAVALFAAVALVGLATPAHAPQGHTAPHYILTSAQKPMLFGPIEYLWAADNTDHMGTLGSCGDTVGCTVINASQGNDQQLLWLGTPSGYTQIITGGSHCYGWNQSQLKVLIQTCTYDSGGHPVTWQLWAGAAEQYGYSIWNDYFNMTFPHDCPFGNGYTQAVLTAFSANSNLGLACNQSPTQYNRDQQWDETTGD